MSLLAGPDVVELIPDVDSTDGYGNTVRVPGSESSWVSVSGTVQYDTTTEDTSGGESVGTTARLMCRSFPAGFAARVTWDGRDWDVVGEPTVHGRGTGVEHTVVRLRARAPRAA